VRLTNVVINIAADPLNNNQVISQIGSGGTPISTNSTEYYFNGWVKSRTAPDGGVTSYAYYDDGQTLSVKDALNHTTTYFYDPAGRQEAVTDALLHTTRFTYDALGRQVATVFEDGSSMSNVFNEVGQRTAQVDQAGLTTHFGYSVSGLLTNVIKPEVPNPTNGYALEAPEWKYRYDDQGRLLVITDPKGHSTTNTFDEFGRQYTHSLPMGGSAETNIYNSLGQLSEQYDFKGQKIEFYYDRYGRLTNKFYFEAGNSAPSNSVAYKFNGLGQLIEIRERSGTNADVGYAFVPTVPSGPHGPGERLWASLFKVPAEVYGGLSALTLLALAMVSIPRRKREELAWALREAWASVAWASRLQPFATSQKEQRWLIRKLHLPSIFWRMATVVTVACLIGNDPSFDRLWTAGAACGDVPTNLNSVPSERITQFSYDFAGRLAQVVSPEGYINYEYNPATGQHTKTCTANSEVEYGYDLLGRLASVHVAKRNGSPVDETTYYTYTKVGNRESVILPNGTVTSYQYDELNRLTNLTHRALGGDLLASYSYQLHSTGRRTNAVEVIQDDQGAYVTNSFTWAYDGLYRLTNEVNVTQGSGVDIDTDYTYDLAGNRLKRVNQATSATTTYAYNENDQLTYETNGTVVTSYTYDANGSLTHQTDGTGSVSYTYNLANRLSQLVVGTTTNTFLYNDSGIRVQKTTGTTATHYLVDANNHTGYAQVLEEFQESGGSPTLSRSYVLGDDVLAQCTTTTADPAYLLYDGHGSTRQLLHTATADVTAQYNYDGYGKSLTQLPSNPETSLLYTGEQYEQYDSGALEQYYLRARYLNPDTGRFNRLDPWTGNNSDPQSLHKYAYAHADPVNGIDPGGYGVLLDFMSSVVIRLAIRFPVVLPIVYALQRVAMRLNMSQMANALRASFYRIGSGVTRVPTLLRTGVNFEKTLNPLMRILGAVKGQQVQAVVNGLSRVAKPDWVFRGRHLVDAKLGQAINVSGQQFQVMIRWAAQNQGTVTYITLSRPPAGVVASAAEAAAAQGVQVRFIVLVPF